MEVLTSIIQFSGKIQLRRKVIYIIKIILDGGGKLPDKTSPLIKAIDAQWGSTENFIKIFSDFFLGIQGAGWANLAKCSKTGQLVLRETKDQDPIINICKDYVPILNADVWEHAWYPSYKNEKKKYITEIWKVINWKDLETRFGEGKAKH